ncbi:PEP-CTERM exosortase interaction domain protein [Acetobacteraceae bacterium AT-5844]|nr:PEP-CTERM exosortase interaction domain protein [Acetobacteraceae bacterium AT-5844]
MRMFRGLGIAAVLSSLAFSAPASAAVIFSFTQTGTSPPGAFSISGTLTVTDSAYANGVSIFHSDIDGRLPETSRLDGLLDLSFRIAVTGGLQRDITMADFFRPRSPGSQGHAYFMNFGSDPGGALRASLRFNNTEDQLDIAMAAPGEGLFISDRGGPACGFAPGCGFTFMITAAPAPTEVAVPEPAAMLLFGTALLGFAGLVRRHGRG